MIAAEAEIEALARTVICPTCDAAPGKRCRGETVRLGNVGPQNYSHLSRLKLARGQA